MDDDWGGGHVKAIKYFFHIGFISLGINSNFMIHIPKSVDSNFINQFHPIMLNNFLFKIIMEIIA